MWGMQDSAIDRAIKFNTTVTDDGAVGSIIVGVFGGNG